MAGKVPKEVFKQFVTIIASIEKDYRVVRTDPEIGDVDLEWPTEYNTFHLGYRITKYDPQRQIICFEGAFGAGAYGSAFIGFIDLKSGKMKKVVYMEDVEGNEIYYDDPDDEEHFDELTYEAVEQINAVCEGRMDPDEVDAEVITESDIEIEKEEEEETGEGQ